jgi:RNA polymerase sigma factor (sigma-70 family)
VETVRGWVQSVVHGGNWRFSDAEGVAQEIQLRLLQIVRDDRVRDPGGFQKFVYSVAKHTCVRIYHRERRAGPSEDPAQHEERLRSETDPQDDLERQERFETMMYVFQRLPGACRELWGWVYGEKLAAAEVGEKLGISVNNVRVRVHRCLQKARAIRESLELAPGSASGANGRFVP